MLAINLERVFFKTSEGEKKEYIVVLILSAEKKSFFNCTYLFNRERENTSKGSS